MTTIRQIEAADLLSRDTDGHSSHVHACRVPTNAVDGEGAAVELAGPDAHHQGRVADVSVSSGAPTGIKRLRLMSSVPLPSADGHRGPLEASQHPLVVDMTQADSDDDGDDDWAPVLDPVDTDDEDETVVDALQQDLDGCRQLWATSAAGEPVLSIDSRLQRSLCQLRFSHSLNCFFLRPTVGESDTDSLENPSICGGESEVDEDHVGREAGGLAIPEVRVTAAIRF